MPPSFSIVSRTHGRRGALAERDAKIRLVSAMWCSWLNAGDGADWGCAGVAGDAGVGAKFRVELTSASPIACACVWEVMEVTGSAWKFTSCVLDVV